MVLRALVLALLFAASAGCGKGDGGPKKYIPCGNGVVDEFETCDIAIEGGAAGACPTECQAVGACNRMELQGTDCAVECVVVEPTCGDPDECCPAGCATEDDTDCEAEALCGNGRLDGAETCDTQIPSGLPGACECPPSGVQCETLVAAGDPSACAIQCVPQAITACSSGDGCCPSGCAAEGDSDCPAICGDGLVEGAELCDGNCPTFCDDGDACTTESLQGSAASCDAICAVLAVTACIDSDGCCPATCDASNDGDCNPVCGNNVIEGGETCDGNCPTACDDGVDCTTDTLVGSPASCDAECTAVSVVACVDNDGCCPSVCDENTDSDCGSVCGNGVVEGLETCDGNCPTVCDDGSACTTNVRGGSAATCNVTCTFVPIGSCIDNDGCCPDACNALNDSDCSASCGNGVVEGTEACDGNCPTSCDDLDACTTDVLAGSAANCTAQCQYPDILACVDGDGCCPLGCAYAVDDDCPCFPDTCATLGLTCGTLAADGCGGGGEFCGTCVDGRTCVQNQCQLDFDVGNPCLVDGDCAGVAGYCVTEGLAGWDAGYCSRACTSNAECGAPNHCGTSGFCWQNCTTNADCRSGYTCHDDDGDGTNECAPAGTGSGDVGDPCTSFSDCAGGDDGFCATAANQFNSGFCMQDCTTDLDCPAGSHCYDAQACVPDCISAADCRGNGYECFDADGNGSSECFRFANGAGAVGASCGGLWDCAGGQWGWCRLPLDGYVGGYCTVLCGSGEGSCPGGTGPGGSTCWFDGGESVCLDNCQNNNHCRTGYLCSDPGAGSDVCHP